MPPFDKTHLALYADDIAIYAHVRCATANRQPQIQMDILTKYFKIWHIKINPEKTENVKLRKKLNAETHKSSPPYPSKIKNPHLLLRKVHWRPPRQKPFHIIQTSPKINARHTRPSESYIRNYWRQNQAANLHDTHTDVLTYGPYWRMHRRCGVASRKEHYYEFNDFKMSVSGLLLA